MWGWVGFSLVVITHLLNIWGICAACILELRYARYSQWYEDFNLLELDDEHPIVSKVDGVTYFDETYGFAKEFLNILFLIN